MSLVHTLPPGPLDVIGDVHGERQALEQLVRHLGYDDDGRHPAGRKLLASSAGKEKLAACKLRKCFKQFESFC